jgi:hypothetical protein
VAGGCWKALRLRDGASYALMANTLSPEFTPDREDWCWPGMGKTLYEFRALGECNGAARTDWPQLDAEIAAHCPARNDYRNVVRRVRKVFTNY